MSSENLKPTNDILELDAGAGSITFPESARKIMFKARDPALVLKYNWASQSEDDVYVTLDVGQVYNGPEKMAFGSIAENLRTVHIESETTDAIVEYEYWS